MRRRLHAIGLVAGGGTLFSFSTIGQFLAGKSDGSSVLALAVGLLVALGALSSQRLIRQYGLANPVAPSELVLTAGYGLLAASAPLAVGFFGPQLARSTSFAVSGDSGVHLSWWPFALAIAVVSLLLIALRRDVLLTTLGIIAVVTTACAIVMIIGVLLAGGFHGNSLTYFTLNGASWRGVVAGVVIAIPFFFGAEALVTRQRDLLDEDRRFSRAALIVLGLIVIFTQYAGVAGTDGTPFLPIDAPSLTGAYVGSDLVGVMTYVVFASCIGLVLLFAYLFSNRLEATGLSTQWRLALVGLTVWLPVVGSMVVATDLRIDTRTNTYAAMTPFLNMSAVAGCVVALGLGVGCVKALRLVVAQQLNAMEVIPPLVGLVGLCLAAYGYLWRDTTTSTWSTPWLVGLLALLVALGAVVVSRAVDRQRS